jgi:transcriptional regulator with XRE-family HTH domain
MSGLSQKEVAALLGMTQATYSTYERGRTEPPAEILVRLSYLFKTPVDVIVQTDRTALTREDAQAQIDDLRKQMEYLKGIKSENAGQMVEAIEALGALLNQVEKLNNSGK